MYSACPIIASTPENFEHFFGYHDLCPWNERDDTLIAMRVERSPKSDKAQICLWTPEAGKLLPIDETSTWNWQQGARAQWVPGRANAVVYNVKIGERSAAVIHDVKTGDKQELPCTIYDFSRDGRYAITPNFARIHHYWSSYGYNVAGGPDIEHSNPDTDGIYRLDLQTGKVDLIVSVADTAQLDAVQGRKEQAHFLAHPTFNLSGSHFCFMDRFITADNAIYSRLIVADRDGQDLKVIADEKATHFDWYDDDVLLVWARHLPRALTALRRRGLTQWPMLRSGVSLLRKLRPTTKQKLFNEAYYWISRTEGVKGILGFGDLNQDGHPMFRGDGRWLVTDTYPDIIDERKQALMLYDLKADTRIDIAALPATEPYVFDATGNKCDLHPRWNRAGTKVCVDSSHTGTRQMHIFDVAQAMETHTTL